MSAAISSIRRCEFCGVELGSDRRNEARFCSDQHRALWHRTHDPRGTVRSVRRLASNKIGVVLHFTDEAALRFRIGDAVVLGGIAELKVEQ